MSRGTKLQEMEKDVNESNAVTAGAKPGDKAIPKLKDPGEGLSTSWEDLGGPTPENYKPDNDSAKLKTPGSTLKQVKDIVNKGAGKADPMKGLTAGQALKSGDEVEVKDDQEVVAEEPAKEEVVAEVEETIAEYDVEEAVNALLGGEELSEEFKEKAKTIFEAAIKSKVAEIKESLQKEYDATLSEKIEEHKVQLTERVDSYLEFVADEWFQENKLAVERGLKSDMTESFLEGMKSLFEEHYVSIPEEKYDVLSAMTDKLDDMETKLNEQIEKNIGLTNRLGKSVADHIVSDVSEGLAETEKEKLASLAEGVEFESEESYKEKLETLKESYFSKGKPVTQSSKSETLSEGVDHTEAPATGMSNYLDMLGRMNK